MNTWFENPFYCKAIAKVYWMNAMRRYDDFLIGVGWDGISPCLWPVAITARGGIQHDQT